MTYFVILICLLLHSMKKIIPFLFIFIVNFCMSQAITVTTNNYTVPQLVNNVLINSFCTNATNITWRTGTNFNSTNGIGYFENTNPNFPISSGVVLSTGDVIQSAGPNNTVLSNGNASWLGDASLEATLLASGIVMNSTNATVLEFDFTPISSNFDFDFLFASEEYGNFQCQFSDAFAFLLTNTSTGVTTNLAIVPGTTTPISVVTIRDSQYNSGCGSSNPQYFGSFNGGTNANTSATNFNGKTVVMNASAMLTPNVTYHIKLVIADRNDFQSDSAIFLASESFNIGQEVLGNDLTVANNTAICFGQTTVLNSQLNPATHTFQWKRNGIILSSQTGSTLTISQEGTYELTTTSNSFPCQTLSYTIIVEYIPEYQTPNPRSLYKCNSGQSSYVYNLDLNTPIVTSGILPNSTVSYHNSLLNANNNTNSLPLNYSSAGNQTVFVRINNPSNGCFTVKSFLLKLVPPPTAYQPVDYILCSSQASGTTATFNLSTLDSQIFNGQDPNIYKIIYYASMSDANNQNNPLPNIFTSTTSTIVAVIQLFDDANCFNTTTINLIVSPTPLVDILPRVITCNNYTLQPLTNGNYFTGSNGSGTALFAGDVISTTQNIYIFNQNATSPFCSNQSIFEIIIIEPQDIPNFTNIYCDGFVIPSTLFGAFYTQSGEGGTILTSGTNITTSQIIYFYFVSPSDPTCIIDSPSDIQIVPSQTVPTFPNGFDCTSFTLPTLSFGNYYDAPNGAGNMIAQGTVLTTSQTIYIFGQVASCISQSSFSVVIGLSFPTDVTECANYQLPQLTAGNYYTQPMGNGTQIAAGTIINTTQTIYVYAVSQSQPNCTDNYNFTVTIILPIIPLPTENTGCITFVLPALSVGNYFTNSGGNGTQLNAGDIITSSQTIYIFLDNGSGCTNEISYSIVVNQPPNIDSRSDIDACHTYTLTNLNSGNYYTGPNGTGIMYNGGQVITTSQLIYIYKIVNNCPAQTSFQVTIYTIIAHQMQNITVCDSYTLPSLPIKNKYYTQTGGQYGAGTEITAGTIINSSQQIFIYTESGERINCTDESSFMVTIIPTPIVDVQNNIFSCNAYTLPILNVGNYYTQSGGNGTQMNAGDVITSNQFLYVYAESGTSVNCFDEKSFLITVYNVDNAQDITTCASYTLPSLAIGNYYNGPNATGGTIAQGSTITASKTIYIYGNPGFNPSCYDEEVFNVTIISRPIANAIPIQNRTVCDLDGTNNGVTLFDLTQLNSIVLGSQSGPEFSVTYHLILSEAISNTNSITNTTANQVFIRVSNTLAPNCFDVLQIALFVNKLPEPKPKDGIICIDSRTGQVLNAYTINSELNASLFSFQWFDSNGNIVSTNANYQTFVTGTFSLIATNNNTGCISEEIFITVNPSEPAIVAYTVNEDFADNQSITVVATGTGGNYEYQIDNGAFQDSPIFENLYSGIHTITVRDKNGCGSTTINALIINYPKYFTPNGDGIHEFWNIYNLADQEDALISIFDRYGKLLKQIRPSGVGWDGYYNNQMMVSDDYWFTVSYKKDGNSKEFKAHFALSR